MENTTRYSHLGSTVDPVQWLSEYDQNVLSRLKVISRTDLAKELKVSKGAITQIVSSISTKTELLQKGLPVDSFGRALRNKASKLELAVLTSWLKTYNMSEVARELQVRERLVQNTLLTLIGLFRGHQKEYGFFKFLFDNAMLLQKRSMNVAKPAVKVSENAVKKKSATKAATKKKVAKKALKTAEKKSPKQQEIQSIELEEFDLDSL